MDELRVRFCDGDQPDLVLEAGTHALGRLPTGLGPVAADGAWLLRLCNDRRGIWMTVSEGMRGIHVNGRPVQQVAMLRPGDSIHVDGAELLLLGAAAPPAPTRGTPQKETACSPRLALRGIGGPHHGRSLGLDTARRIGSANDADIRIQGERIAPAHAVVEACDGHAVLRDAAGDVLVNGHPVREALLRDGDQVAFGAQHRFVVEAPPPPIALERARSAFAADADQPPDPGKPHWSRRVPWLLIAALALAAALFALFVFGAR